MAHSKLYVKLMNSKEWRTLRNEKLRSQPLCERCQAHGWVVPARCVHHIVPVENSRSEAEARDNCFRFSNLQSLCFRCHSEIHQAEQYHSTQATKERNKERIETWKDSLIKRFK